MKNLGPQTSTILLIVIIAAIGFWFGGCEDSDSSDDDSGPDENPFELGDAPYASASEVWLIGKAIREFNSQGFILKWSETWDIEYLELPFASTNLHALAALDGRNPWIAGEGMVTLESGPLTTFLYSYSRQGLVEIPAPDTSLAITGICFTGNQEAWIVAAKRVASGFNGFAAFWDGEDWTENTPEVPAGIQRWNLSGADIPQEDTGASLGLISDNPDGAGIIGALFLLEQGDWTMAETPFDPAQDVYIFTDIHYTNDEVVAIGRANLAGWIGTLDLDSLDWTVEEFLVMDGISPMWEINSLVSDKSGKRWALGSMELTGLQEPLILYESGNGWEMATLPDTRKYPYDHLQLREGLWPEDDFGLVTMSEYNYDDGQFRDVDQVWSYDGTQFSTMQLPLADERYQFRALAVVSGR